MTETRTLTRLRDGRVVWLPKVWRRCETGVTIDPPPSMPERRARPAPRLTEPECAVLEELRIAAAGGEGWVPRLRLRERLWNTKVNSPDREAALEGTLTRLDHLGLITIDHTRSTAARLFVRVKEEA